MESGPQGRRESRGHALRDHAGGAIVLVDDVGPSGGFLGLDELEPELGLGLLAAQQGSLQLVRVRGLQDQRWLD